MSKFKVGQGVLVGHDIGVISDITDNGYTVLFEDGEEVWYSQSNNLVKFLEPDSHYKKKVEPIDLIEAFELDFNAGNVIKYVARAKHKGNEKDDLRKALYYLKRLIDEEVE